MTGSTRRDRIIQLLEERFSPLELDVRDVSNEHHGHAGWRESGETHFEVDIRAEELTSLGRIDGHRQVNETLKPELDSGLHALQIRIKR